MSKQINHGGEFISLSDNQFKILETLYKLRESNADVKNTTRLLVKQLTEIASTTLENNFIRLLKMGFINRKRREPDTYTKRGAPPWFYWIEPSVHSLLKEQFFTPIEE